MSSESQPSVAPEAAVSTAEPVAQIAWQPITPAGVARFAEASFANVLAIQLVVVALFTASVFWFLTTAWFPSVRELVKNLPSDGQVRSAELQWPHPSPRTLVENRFLGCAIDIDEFAPVVLASDVRIEFHRTQLTICSLFGCVARPYWEGYIVDLNRGEAEPWWGAWEPILLGAIAIGVPIFVLLLWGFLAVVYTPIPWLIGYFADRQVTWSGAWRLSCGALLPGALVLTVSIVGYGSKSIDVVQLVALFGLHLVVGWAYLVSSPFFLPKLAASAKAAANPFAAPPTTPE